MKRLFYSIFLFSFFLNVSGQDTLIVSDLEKQYEVNRFVEVYSTTENLSSKQALDDIGTGLLTKLEEKVNLGMIENSKYWVLFSISNKTSGTLKYLEVLNPQLDYIGLYEIIDSQPIEKFITGDQFVFDKRPVQYRNFILPLTIPTDSARQYLLQIEKKASSVNFPLSLYDSSIYAPKVTKEGIFFGIYFGVLALVSLFSLIVGIVIKQRVFVIYGIYVFAFSMWFFSREGFSYEFITSNYPVLNTHFYPACTSMACLWLIIYIQSFFDTKRLLPNFHKVMSVMIVVFLVAIVMWVLFPQEHLDNAPKLFAIRYSILMLTIVFAYTSAIKSWNIYPLRSKLFLFGYTMFFLGIFSEIANEYGLFDLHTFVIPPIMFGYLVEVGALSIAMGSIILGVLKQRDELAVTNDQLTKIVKNLEIKKNNSEKTFITLKSRAVIDHDNIRYIQSDDHYLEYYLIDRDNPEIDRDKISLVKERLPSEFAQIHRSTIVNLKYVKSIFSDRVELRGGEELRLSRTYKKELNNQLKS